MTDKKPSIPFLDLKKINKSYKQKSNAIFSSFLDSGIYIKGNSVEKFENAFATFCGVKYCIGTGNGLDALTLILKGYVELGKINIGDEVIVAANTYIATILSVIHAGLKPILIEPNEETFNIGIDHIKKSISPRTKVILPTHLYGQLAPMKDINALAKEKGFLVISDAAQAHGAKDKHGNTSGSLCDASAFSFYPTKNLGALGDGGAITTNNEDLAEIVRSLGNYGTSSKYENEYIGFNSRLDEIQAAFLFEKLLHLDGDNIKRRNIAKLYISCIKNDKIKLPSWDGSDAHVFHLFVVRVKNRKHFCDYLTNSGIGYLIHYPIPPHRQKALAEFSYYCLPITERIHEEVISIPLNIGLKDSEIEEIIKTLNDY
ncbi:DegT/DnrJ/EryC1/StrS family aminotransferase [Aquimarina sp. MMG016]|uniref:DegT/DnrJ/EryC1/StrS family aminotransferase n=1 Tax=Aquimarina sp. MMG016 TaxID=2822690 RepID=UPI001B3A534A|nr:DegT/DnrJ/EryC1/StrS family aminotransferase [Aquimarina sp. MMG016]MBQ4822198.1 DegT/DnrJ/EryC1/StrS family aminotransferase [Aquimarina sp. MMG016]